jgi:hypothetical protein
LAGEQSPATPLEVNMIKVKPRAKISSDFIDEYRRIVEAKSEMEEKKIRSLKGDRRKAYLDKRKYVRGRLNAISSKETVPGKGMDLEITRLRALGFEEFGIACLGEVKFFGGITPEMAMDEVGRGGKIVAKWDIGRFEAYISVDDVISSCTGRIHFIPTRDRQTYNRHPHHVGRRDGGSTNPLGYSPNTCWSDFGGPVTMALNEGNIPELFRMFLIFIGRYYNGSPLTRGFDTHMKRL